MILPVWRKSITTAFGVRRLSESSTTGVGCSFGVTNSSSNPSLPRHEKWHGLCRPVVHGMPGVPVAVEYVLVHNVALPDLELARELFR